MTAPAGRFPRELTDHRRHGLQPSRTRGWMPDPIPDHLCQLCEQDLDGSVTDDGLCSECRRLLETEDHQAWVEAGGRTCRRCHLEVHPAGAVEGRCPCGGELL